MAEERLQKILSRSGYGSRRQCEELIIAGRVVVNGSVARIGSKGDLITDDILVDGQAIKGAERKVYIALYKPRGVISAVNPQDDRKTVRDLVDIPEQIYPVGRLDFNSEGLMLMTSRIGCQET
jgi:23S rRNA pseudouridine2605 synthase